MDGNSFNFTVSNGRKLETLLRLNLAAELRIACSVCTTFADSLSERREYKIFFDKTKTAFFAILIQVRSGFVSSLSFLVWMNLVQYMREKI